MAGDVASEYVTISGDIPWILVDVAISVEVAAVIPSSVYEGIHVTLNCATVDACAAVGIATISIHLH